MTQFSVRIEPTRVYAGLHKVADGLEPLTRDQMDTLIEDAQYEASGGYSGGNTYANVPTVSGQVYERTGNLGRSTYWERDGLTYRMYSRAISPTGQSYSQSVVGRADGSGQTWVFVGRWPNFGAVMQKWAGIAVERMRQAKDIMVGAAFGI